MPHKPDFLDASDTFEYVRVEGPVPAEDPQILDVAILDMNHSWPNLGHDSIVQIIREASDRMQGMLKRSGLKTRVLSFDVRQKLLLPEHGERFQLYIGTGGPGHLDPRENDGTKEGSQGIHEDPSWEAPLFKLFDDVMKDPAAALRSICHSFGLMCRWSGIAEPHLRGSEKGGKSNGIVEVQLSEAGIRHPWFARMARDTKTANFRVLDNRLYDLRPVVEELPEGANVIAFATWNGQADREAITAIEFARDADGTMPRVLAVNHHPEILDRVHLMNVLNEKLDRGEVTKSWYDERAAVFKDEIFTPSTERDLRLSSHYTFIGPVDYHMQRIVRDRLKLLRPTPAHA